MLLPAKVEKCSGRLPQPAGKKFRPFPYKTCTPEASNHATNLALAHAANPALTYVFPPHQKILTTYRPELGFLLRNMAGRVS